LRRQLFIGRWQPFHYGHEWLIRQELDKGNPVMVAIRNVAPDDKNPFTPEEVKQMLDAAFGDDEDVLTFILPDDISGVNYGRGVGYEINEHVPPEDVKRVSATAIREAIAVGDNSWKNYVNDNVAEWLLKYYAKQNK